MIPACHDGSQIKPPQSILATVSSQRFPRDCGDVTAPRTVIGSFMMAAREPPIWRVKPPQLASCWARTDQVIRACSAWPGQPIAVKTPHAPRRATYRWSQAPARHLLGDLNQAVRLPDSRGRRLPRRKSGEISPIGALSAAVPVASRERVTCCLRLPGAVGGSYAWPAGRRAWEDALMSRAIPGLWGRDGSGFGGWSARRSGAPG